MILLGSWLELLVGDLFRLMDIFPKGGGGGGYSDIFIHTSDRVIFWVQNFEFQYFLVF